MRVVRGREEREEKRVDRRRGDSRKNERRDEHLGPHEWFF